jgi:hypothetical protein
MESSTTEAFATRLPVEEVVRFEQACDQAGLSTSDFVALGLRHYFQQNPDNIPAFYPNDEELGPLQQLGVLRLAAGSPST